MHHHYNDILRLTDQEPSWWDENAVPRFCEFRPHEVAYIYADEVVLLHIECQACRHPFRVAFSTGQMTRYRDVLGRPEVADRERMREMMREHTLAHAVVTDQLHYGDPPNYKGCCAAGSTMNSIPIRVLEFWVSNRNVLGGWERVEALERSIDPPWKDA